MKKYLFIIGWLIFLMNGWKAGAQTCTTLGQNPSTAFPVCGIDTFSQKNVPLCGNRVMVTKGCGNAPYTDQNPFWYKFTCFTSGTLGFLITPLSLQEDYDWQLFDVTNISNLDQVYNDVNLIVASNWSGDKGLTGASSAGTSLFLCGGNGVPLFSAMPNLIAGHDYLLMISHFESTQSGYKLSFGGGTAVITDPKSPQLLSARAPCDGTIMAIRTNKKMRCTSLSTDGSEFVINGTSAKIVSAKGGGCDNGFDTDSIVITLDKPLNPGNYTVTIKKGTDGNTLLDYCNAPIPDGNNVNVTIFPLFPTPMDSVISNLNCKPSYTFLHFSRPIRCNSVAKDGSDFKLSGPSNITINKAIPVTCTYDSLLGVTLATDIEIDFSQPIETGGIYTVTLVKGTDGNTLLNNCGVESIPNATLNFTVKQAVSATFSFTQSSTCTTETLKFAYNGFGNANNWQWNFNNEGTSSISSPTYVFTTYGTKVIQLITNNGICSDTVKQTIVLIQDTIKSAFDYQSIVCPEDVAIFTDKSIGKIVRWQWDFGNGNTASTAVVPPQTYTPFASGTTLKPYSVQLIVTNKSNCSDTVIHKVMVPPNCYIAVPTAFSPNNDGVNDYLSPLNAYKATNLLFQVYNRLGQLVFESKDWTQKWDGTVNGQKQDAGVYIWQLSYTDVVTSKFYALKGTSVLLR